MNHKKWEDLCAEAEACLPSNFAHRVIIKAGQATQVRAQARREKWLALSTAFVLGSSIALTHWITSARENHQNVARWQIAQCQTEVLETTL